MDNNQIFSLSNPHLFEIICCRAINQVSTELDGETVILDVSAGIYSGLDQVGTAIWKLMEVPVSFSELIETMLNTYEVSKERCVDDLLLFLRELADNNLIDVSNGTIA